MNLELSERLFVVTGSTSGFGRSIAQQLIDEGAHVIINARGEDKLLELHKQYPNNTSILQGDITTDAVISNLVRLLHDRQLSGIIVNAGGPPAKSFAKTTITDWDNAYNLLLRWKVKLVHELLEKLMHQQYGRILFIESISVKYPIQNLILSNALRMAVVGFVKTLSEEMASYGITANIIAPGYHATAAMERLYEARSVLLGISPEEAKLTFEKEVSVGHLGDPNNLAKLAVWLLSPSASYITGQTISIDGGMSKSSF